VVPQICRDGECVCPDTYTFCPLEGCVDLMTAHDSCGSCENLCPGDQECVGGVCACPADLAWCEGLGTECVDVQTDPCNCGTCGEVCDGRSGGQCLNGACTCPAGLVLCRAPNNYPEPLCGGGLNVLVCCHADKCHNGVCRDRCIDDQLVPCGKSCCDPRKCERCVDGKCIGCPLNQRCMFEGTPNAVCVPKPK
jgi:hypothetical protein